MISIFDPLRLGTVALDVMLATSASPQDLQARQMTRLASVLDAANRGSRFYRERLNGKAGTGVVLGGLPSVTRGELMAHFDDWVTDPQLKLAALREFTADPHCIGQSYLDQYLVWESSGTSHESGVFVQDAQVMAVYDALEMIRRGTSLPVSEWFDPLSMNKRIAFVGATNGHFASIVSMLRLQALNPFMAQSLQCFSILQSTSDLVAALNAFEPTVIATYPTVASLLADEAMRGTLTFRPTEVWTGGETLTAAVRRRVGMTLGCSIHNSYGASEFMSIGWECSLGHMHANTDWVILEPVDEKGRAVPSGHPSYSTLLTNLANHVQPLIRYDLGDQLSVHAACACGSSLPVIDVRGRRDDPLVMKGGQGQPVTLLPLALTTVLEDEAGVFDFQVLQQNDHSLVLRLGPCGAEDGVLEARCRAALSRFAVTLGLAPLQVAVELGQAIPRGRSGKAQRVVAHPGARHHR